MHASTTKSSGPNSLSSRLVQREYYRSRIRLDSQFLADAGKNFLLVVITSLISTLAALGITPNAIIVGGVGAAMHENSCYPVKVFRS